MREPKTADDVLAFHKLRKSDPRGAVRAATDWIAENPASAPAHYSRHLALLDVGETQKALADITTAIELDPTPTRYSARGDVHRSLGQYDEAIADYGRAEAMDPDQWEGDAIPLLYQGDAYARSGNAPMALACCARLPDHFWTPGPDGTPAGNKAQVAEELKRRAADARRRQGKA